MQPIGEKDKFLSAISPNKEQVKIMVSANRANAIMAGMDLAGFAGQWVAIEGAKVVAHGKDLKSVCAQLNAASLRRALFAKVPGSETMIL